MKNMPPEALEEVAGYFQVLAEPTRLRILNILRRRAQRG
jgi:DNA-binding transcriptional ArsR family regulator